MNSLWFEPYLLEALRSVKRGDIVTDSPAGVLRHRTFDIASRAFSALCILYRDGHIYLGDGTAGADGWIVANLTPTGEKLLIMWTMHVQRENDNQTNSRGCPPKSGRGQG